MTPRITRSVSQSLYKYLPDCWISFPVHDNGYYQYIAHVTYWNSEKLDGINKPRLIRTVNQALNAFVESNPTSETSGFGDELTLENCEVLTPKHDTDDRGIVAEISPLTFYCPECHRVYQFKNVETYRKHKKCHKCQVELKQLQMIYYCKCGYASDRHPVFCKKCHSSEYITWSGQYEDYAFHCQKCGSEIQMIKKCESCGERLMPKLALSPSQYFPHTLSLIDIIDEKVERFISETDYGVFLTIAFWLGLITRDELNEAINKGIISDPDAYQKKYDASFKLYKDVGLDDISAATAARAQANSECNTKFMDVVNEVRALLSFTSRESHQKTAEALLEYLFVKELEDCSTLEDAKTISQTLNTNANPEEFVDIAQKRAISSVQVCGNIPFISCSYGFTRDKCEPEEGVKLHAFHEEKHGTKNIYAAKLNTEGVLFEFDRVKILKWLDKNNYVDKNELPDYEDELAVKLWFIRNINVEQIKPFSEIESKDSPTFYVYNLIHTLSHLLIRSAAEMCGLDKNSISEYILPSVPAVLIYCQNSQGFNLGALFNIFEAYFDKWLNTAFSNAKRCIFDPICINRYKACTNCLFLNEISCQHFNHDLDRSLVIGTVDRETGIRHYGFWED